MHNEAVIAASEAKRAEEDARVVRYVDLDKMDEVYDRVRDWCAVWVGGGWGGWAGAVALRVQMDCCGHAWQHASNRCRTWHPRRQETGKKKYK